MPVARSPEAPAPRNFYFDFQVHRAATLESMWLLGPIPDPTIRPPVRGVDPDYALVQFVVDSEGCPLENTLKLLLHPSALEEEYVRMAMTAWHYQPALLNDQPVAQLVQTPLRWRT